MGDRSGIEWTDATWTPIRARNTKTVKVGWHCAHVTPGCENCYAERLNLRLGTGLPFKPGHLANGDVELYLDEAMLTQPLRWKKPRMIFVCSMTDLFGEFVPDEWIERVFAVMALSPQHTFQVLTKRSKWMRQRLSDDWFAGNVRHQLNAWADVGRVTQQQCVSACVLISEGPLPHCWLGVSAEDQLRADERIPDLLATPAAVRFVSYEPALSAIDFSRYLGACHESSRDRVSSPSGARDVYHRPKRSDLATQGMEQGKSFRLGSDDDVSVNASPSGREHVRSERWSADGIQTGDIRCEGPTVESPGSSGCLDGGEWGANTGRLGDQSRRWERAEQHTDQPPCDNDIGEHPSQLQDARPENQGAARREKRIGETNPRPGDRNPSSGSDEINASAQDRRSVRRGSADHIEYPHKNDLGSPRIDWLIAGGESGPGARPALKSWFQSARDQCAAAGVAYFHKGNGEWIDADAWATILGHRGDSSPLNYCDASRLADMGNFPFEHRSDGTTMIRVGKARAGRLLDGRTHDEMPGAKP